MPKLQILHNQAELFQLFLTDGNLQISEVIEGAIKCSVSKNKADRSITFKDKSVLVVNDNKTLSTWDR